MRVPVKLAHVPPRLATGAFILYSGLSKRHADEQTAAGTHGMAARAYPFLKKIEPRTFTKLLSAAEMALGAALLAPVVPTALAGLGLAAFGGGLVGMYLRTPSLREPGSLGPSEQGVAIAKDVWLLGTGLGFVVEAITDRCACRR